MRAVRVVRFGGPEVLEPADLPPPIPGPGQLLVEVAHAEVLFHDTLCRSGCSTRATEDPSVPSSPPSPPPSPPSGAVLPYVPGGAVGGRVVGTGEGIAAAWQGRYVVGRTPDGTGGYAERALVDVTGLRAVPHGLARHEAAALVHDGPGALRLFDLAVSAGSLRPGGRVLVLAAGGGLGTLLVRLAKVAGAHVLAVTYGERKRKLLRDELGAEVVLDAGPGPGPGSGSGSGPGPGSGWTDAVRAATGGKGVDLVLDGAGGALGTAAFGVVARGGRFSAHGAASGSFAAVGRTEAEERGVTLVGAEQLRLSPEEAGPLLERALQWAANGTVPPVVGQVFPLEDAAAAHAAAEARETVGRTLLTVG